MKCSALAKRVAEFLRPRVKPKDLLLLGLSGGNDSLALFYLLIECQKMVPFELQLAHVDYGWRPQEHEEAQVLVQLAKKLGFQLHLHTLSRLPERDRENWARQERLAFFTALWHRRSYRALLLAHHSDDQAETVLKRIGEGAGLLGLGGLVSERTIGDLVVYRPLLMTRKKELRAYLKRRQLKPFSDPLNADPMYLRARMRQMIFPHFERFFGKQVATQFTAFGQLWQEMQAYLEKKSRPLKERIVRGPFGVYLRVDPSDDDLELKWIVLNYAASQGANLSRSACTQLIELIRKKAPKAQIEAPPLRFVVNQHHLFILTRFFPSFFEKKELWNKTESRLGWIHFWLGRVYYPKQYDQIVSLNQLVPRDRKRLKEWYRTAGVPLFLRDKAPIFIKKNVIVSECLTQVAIERLKAQVRV
ncbi:MAG: tRNA lysidine(34) synthetase TilS [Chlamydiota bacterium]